MTARSTNTTSDNTPNALAERSRVHIIIARIILHATSTPLADDVLRELRSRLSPLPREVASAVWSITDQPNETEVPDGH